MTDPTHDLVEIENRDHAEAQKAKREEREAVAMVIGGVLFFFVWWVLMQM